MGVDDLGGLDIPEHDPACADLVRANMAFVARVALEYRGRGVSVEDLFQEGCVALIEAAGRYDPSWGVKFITFAVKGVRWAMWDALGARGAVRAPHRQGTAHRKIAARQALAEQQRGRAVAWDEAAEGYRAAGGRNAGHAVVMVPLDKFEELAPRAADDPAAGVEGEDDARLAEDMLAAIPLGRDRDVMRALYGFDGYPDKPTLSEVGRRFGLTKERVRQIRDRELRRMRKRLYWDHERQRDG